MPVRNILHVRHIWRVLCVRMLNCTLLTLLA